MLSFTAWNQFKQDNQYPGAWEVTSASGAKAKGHFFFSAHWRPAKVTATLPNGFSDAGSLNLIVANIWGVETEGVEVACK